MQKDIKITALIPAFNAEKYIKRSIESALGQTYKPYEILVVDDGSKDRTTEIVQAYGSLVTYLYKDNGGSSSARNLGISKAQGDWIAFLDSDDEWVDTHLENFVRIWSHKQDLMWYGAPVKQLEEVSGKLLFSYKIGRNKELCKRDYFNDYLCALPPEGFFSTPTMIINKDVFKKTGLFVTTKETGEDIDMWFRIGLHYPEIGYCTKMGANVYKRVDSLSHSKPWDPDQSIKRFKDSEQLAKTMGIDYVLRAEPRIIYWVEKLLRAAIMKSDLNTLEKIREVYYHRLPFRYRIMFEIIEAFPSFIKILKTFK